MENNENMQSYFDMTDEVAQGTYSNLAVISHSSSEFILDFVRIVPGVRKGNVKSRVIMTPEHAKRLLFALQENIVKLRICLARSGYLKLSRSRLFKARLDT